MTEIVVPISVGELVDKVTILRIKSTQIKDAQKLENIRNELVALEETCLKNKIDLKTNLVAELEAINLKLWDVEDELREKERTETFDKEFINLARAVYFTNDKRADIKKQINLSTGSKFVEEKSYKNYQK